MALSKSADKLRKTIEKAIEDQEITRSEMDMILFIAAEDSHIDKQEMALLSLLQDMIDNKEVKIIP